MTAILGVCGIQIHLGKGGLLMGTYQLTVTSPHMSLDGEDIKHRLPKWQSH